MASIWPSSNVQNEVRVDRREGGVDLAGIFFVHGHGDLKAAPHRPRLCITSKLPMSRPSARRGGVLRLLAHHVLAFERDIES